MKTWFWLILSLGAAIFSIIHFVQHEWLSGETNLAIALGAFANYKLDRKETI